MITKFDEDISDTTHLYYSLCHAVRVLEETKLFAQCAGYKNMSDKIEEDIGYYKQRYEHVSDDLKDLGKRKQEEIENDKKRRKD